MIFWILVKKRCEEKLTVFETNNIEDIEFPMAYMDHINKVPLHESRLTLNWIQMMHAQPDQIEQIRDSHRKIPTDETEKGVWVLDQIEEVFKKLAVYPDVTEAREKVNSIKTTDATGAIGYLNEALGNAFLEQYATM
eukprot:GHVU01111608.1.p2 GENE.GHVU01111608.1~~GHVU01111608.1.p2  ORF type:complete len:137 (-),score=26.28 GHVU01111608.1:70-480(-)